jgi:hypothetical protein
LSLLKRNRRARCIDTLRETSVRWRESKQGERSQTGNRPSHY